MKEITGTESLLRVLRGEAAHPSRMPYDDEAEITQALIEMEYLNPSGMEDSMSGNHQKFRARVRYLAALWPDEKLIPLTHRIHGIIGNKSLTVEDIRLILGGYKLSDPTQKTKEIPLGIIQGIGKSLRDGASLRETARQYRVAYDSVQRIEEFLGLNRAYKLRESDQAYQAAREGLSVRQLSRKLSISHSKAERLLGLGRSIMAELGEI